MIIVYSKHYTMLIIDRKYLYYNYCVQNQLIAHPYFIAYYDLI